MIVQLLTTPEFKDHRANQFFRVIKEDCAHYFIKTEYHEHKMFGYFKDRLKVISNDSNDKEKELFNLLTMGYCPKGNE